MVINVFVVLVLICKVIEFYEFQGIAIDLCGLRVMGDIVCQYFLIVENTLNESHLNGMKLHFEIRDHRGFNLIILHNMTSSVDHELVGSNCQIM